MNSNLKSDISGQSYKITKNKITSIIYVQFYIIYASTYTFINNSNFPHFFFNNILIYLFWIESRLFFTFFVCLLVGNEHQTE